MRILVVNTVPTDKNGITNVIFNYLSFLKQDIGRVDYVSLNQPDKFYVDIIKKCSGHVYVLARSSNNVFSYWNSLRRLIKDNNYDAVHIHGNSHTVTLELLASRIARCKVRIVHAHSTKCGHLVAHRLLSPLFNLLCTHRIACGNEAGRFMFGNKVFLVMNNGIDTEKYAFNANERDIIRRQNGWERKVVVGHVGYFMELKNQSFIVDIFCSLFKQNPNYRLVFIGDGPLKGYVQRKINDLGLKELVCMTGNIDNVNEYLNAMDVIVMPSLFEGMPLTLVEQQANGLPCVVSDTITRDANITGNLRFLSLSDSIDTWANAVFSANDGMSRGERSSKAVESIKKAGYSIALDAEKLENFYFSCI